MDIDKGRTGSDFAGRLIVLDGPDGCGKSSQARMLMDWLQGQGVATAGFRDPGATVIGDNLRRIVKDDVQHRHPDQGEAKVKCKIPRIVLGDRLFNEAFGVTRPLYRQNTDLRY